MVAAQSPDVPEPISESDAAEDAHLECPVGQVFNPRTQTCTKITKISSWMQASHTSCKLLKRYKIHHAAKNMTHICTSS